MRELECCDYRTEITPETGNEKIFLVVTVHNINKQKTEEIFCKVVSTPI